MLKNYQMFRESQEIKIGDETNMGKVIWMDNPFKTSGRYYDQVAKEWKSNPENAGKEGDISIKTDKPSNGQDFTWTKLSKLTKIDNPKEIRSEKITTTMSDLKPEIEFADLMKSDIRVCKVEKAEKIKGKDRLLVLTVSTGFDERQIVTNLGGSYTPEDLQGKLYPFILNLKPSRIGGVESKGMIFAADNREGKPYLIEVSAPVGSRIL